jgi:hypothetical protein
MDALQQAMVQAAVQEVMVLQTHLNIANWQRLVGYMM